MTTKTEIYNWLTAILDNDTFSKNNSKEIIGIKKKLTESEIDGLMCTVLNMIGNQASIIKEGDSLSDTYRFNSRYVDIDDETIILNKNGKLCVDIEHLIGQDDIIKKLLENAEFIEKIKTSFKPVDISMDYVKKDLLTDSKFLTTLTNIVIGLTKLANGELADDVTADNIIDGETIDKEVTEETTTD